ncbi:predicted protein [Sclerotinia sclerotiorum 1980 UF-70]|uniref:Uncharacterized protein n=1 Tax=Sclerotinia sclerotiorum (strain ATCC 18683 / 1980 / Ss-1) TaxID=665079 RepID=A7F8G4_SCLS1|nr:predicted protein [Sclerotinia sclerotiorum 1980 UF-70]EDN99035.1 predicted protein [Sclerotinia sclerotiorum 1980 UF-70]
MADEMTLTENGTPSPVTQELDDLSNISDPVSIKRQSSFVCISPQDIKISPLLCKYLDYERRNYESTSFLPPHEKEDVDILEGQLE